MNAKPVSTKKQDRETASSSIKTLQLKRGNSSIRMKTAQSMKKVNFNQYNGATSLIITSLHFYFLFFLSDFCAGSACQNGAQCVNTGFAYTCDCLEGYHGEHCEVIDCMQNRCLNDATCDVVGSTYTCSCPPSVIGVHCDCE